MKQVLQNLKTGEVEVAEVPAPVIKPGHLLIQTRCSLISSGTERMLVSFAKSSLITKAGKENLKRFDNDWISIVKKAINELENMGNYF